MLDSFLINFFIFTLGAQLVSERLNSFYTRRYPLASTINVLSLALYAVFAASDGMCGYSAHTHGRSWPRAHERTLIHTRAHAHTLSRWPN